MNSLRTLLIPINSATWRQSFQSTPNKKVTGTSGKDKIYCNNIILYSYKGVELQLYRIKAGKIIIFRRKKFA